MALEGGERDVVEDAFVAGFEDDGRGASRVVGLLPAQGAETPPVARLETWELILRPRGREVVSGVAAEGEELGRHLGAHDVAAHVVGVRPAVAITEETGERRETAGFKTLAEDVPDRSGGGRLHEFIQGHQHSRSPPYVNRGFDPEPVRGDVDVTTPVLERRGDVLIAVGGALGEGDVDVAAPCLAGVLVQGS